MKQDTLRRVATGLEILATALIIGAAVSEAFQRSERDEKEPQNKRGISTQMTIHATRLLNRTQEQNESLQNFMQSRYYGLYLLGRAGHQLSSEELESVSRELAHFHEQYFKVVGHDADRALAEWYKTSGQSRRIPIQTLLAKSVIVDKALGIPAYIAYCLTGNLAPSYKSDIDVEEWEVIKKHLSLN